jgi:FkbH-like protein
METRSSWSETRLAHELREADQSGRRQLAVAALQATGSRFDPSLADLLRTHLDRAAADELPDTACSAWIRATKATDDGDHAAAVLAWDRFFRLCSDPDPSMQAGFARSLTACGEMTRASLQLQAALQRNRRYSLFPKIEGLVSKLASTGDSWLRETRIAVLGTSTTSLLIPVLRALCFRDRIRAEVYEGLYGAPDQEILDASRGLAKFRPAIVFLPLNWRDAGLPGMTADPEAVVSSFIEHRKMLWTRLTEQFGCHVVQHAFDFPATEPFAYLGASLAGGRTRILDLLNRRMREEASSSVSVLDTPSLQRETGAGHWEDPMQWNSFRQHPSTEALPDLAELMLAHIRAVLGLTKKVLIVDLDNTLWKGVIGEDGVEGIEAGPGTAAGEAHQALQQYMADLKSRGILLAVASKNNPGDARQPFLQHPHFRLKLEDFAAFEANWNDKATSIRNIAEKLSLGLDSFVFLDDNPLEREWVRSQLPQVAVVAPGPKPHTWVRDLDRHRYFFSLTLSAEDLSRADQYRSEAQRESLRVTAQSMEEFLSQLQLQAKALPVTDRNVARVVQLINKTNQFNTTTKRYTEGQLRQVLDDSRSWVRAFDLQDRMGSYGLIGVMLCRPAGNDDWEIDTWLMSCRTLGRQMERFMFDRMVEAAIGHGVQAIYGIYKPTARNALVAELFEQLGFAPVSADDSEKRYCLKVPAEVPCTAPFVENLSEQGIEAAG